MKPPAISSHTADACRKALEVERWLAETLRGLEEGIPGTPGLLPSYRDTHHVLRSGATTDDLIESGRRAREHEADLRHPARPLAVDIKYEVQVGNGLRGQGLGDPGETLLHKRVTVVQPELRERLYDRTSTPLVTLICPAADLLRAEQLLRLDRPELAGTLAAHRRHLEGLLVTLDRNPATTTAELVEFRSSFDPILSTLHEALQGRVQNTRGHTETLPTNEPVTQKRELRTDWLVAHLTVWGNLEAWAAQAGPGWSWLALRLPKELRCSPDTLRRDFVGRPRRGADPDSRLAALHQQREELRNALKQERVERDTASDSKGRARSRVTSQDMRLAGG